MTYLRAAPNPRNPSPRWHIERQGKPACRVKINEPDTTTKPPPHVLMCPACLRSIQQLKKLGRF